MKIYGKLSKAREFDSALMSLNLIQEEKLQTSVLLVHALTSRCGPVTPMPLLGTSDKDRESHGGVRHRIQFVNTCLINGWVNFNSASIFKGTF